MEPAVEPSDAEVIELVRPLRGPLVHPRPSRHALAAELGQRHRLAC